MFRYIVSICNSWSFSLGQLLADEHWGEWQSDDSKREKVEIDRFEEPFVEKVSQVEKPMSDWHALRLWPILWFSRIVDGNFTNAGDDGKRWIGLEINGWKFHDDFETDVARNEIRGVLSLGTFHDVNELGNPCGGHLHETKGESEAWMGENFWLAQGVLHHVKARSSGSDKVEMEQEGGEDQTQLERHTAVVLKLDSSEIDEAIAEENLDGKHEECLVKKLELITLGHL